MFGNNLIGLLLLITHILSCITVGFIFRFWKKSFKTSYSLNKFSTNKEVSFSDLGEIFSTSITSSIKTILMIGGFIVLFSVILSILKDSRILSILGTVVYPIFKLFGINNIDFSIGFISGIFEVTNGLNIIANIPCRSISYNIILTSFLLGFGGISVLLQVYSILAKSKISIKPYIIGKLLHGLIACIYTFIIIYTIPIFNLDF